MYRVDCGQGQAILKLNCTERETEILKKLGGVSNVVQLLGHEMVTGFKD